MIRKLLFGTAFAVLAAASLVVPLPFVVLAPGPVLEVDDVVDVGPAPDALDGAVLLTTVRLERPTTVEAAAVLVDDDRELLSRRQIVPPGVDAEEFARRQRRILRESARVAAAVGQRAAGLDVTIEGDGATVVQVLPGAPAQGELETGDVILAVDGEDVELASELSPILGQRRAGDIATLTVEREGERLQVDVELARIDELDQAGLGIAAQTRDRTIELPVDVEVQTDTVGGPSAGLMIAIAVYDLVDRGDLLQGRTVAGTGTIDTSGRVGPVAGVSEKVDAAIDRDASVFLVSDGLADEARAAADGALDVIAVSDVDEAIEQLKEPAGS